MRNNAVLFPGRQFWLRRGKNEKWVFFDCVDDAVDDVFTKVAGAVDRLGIISQISKFHRRAQDKDAEGKRQLDRDFEYRGKIGIGGFIHSCFQKPLEEIEKSKCLHFYVLREFGKYSTNLNLQRFPYPLLIRGRKCSLRLMSFQFHT